MPLISTVVVPSGNAVLSPADIAVPIRDVFRNYSNVRVLMVRLKPLISKITESFLKAKKFLVDYLVVATGARHSYFGNDEWEQYTGGLKTIKDALKIREKILLSFEKAERELDPQKRQKFLNFVVVGGGPTGVGVAGSIADIASKI